MIAAAEEGLLDYSVDDPWFCYAVEGCSGSREEEYHRVLKEYKYGPFGDEGESRGWADDATWILTSSFVILTMQSGFGMLEAGSCSPGWEVNIMMKNIVDVVCCSMAYYLFAYGISFGTPATPFMGTSSFP